MILGSLFAGIGGFELAAIWAGIQPVWSLDKDTFCCEVLRKNFTHRIIESDVEKYKPEKLETVDIISGGDPCQPNSFSGLRKGQADHRYQWHNMFRILSIKKPTWVINENVFGSISNLALDKKISDLESIGYTCQAYCIPACALEADHTRERIFLVAHSDVFRRQRSLCNNQGIFKESHSTPITLGTRVNARYEFEKRMAQPPVFGVHHGIPNAVDQLGALGNSIVPQVAYELFKAIVEYEKAT